MKHVLLLLLLLLLLLRLLLLLLLPLLLLLLRSLAYVPQRYRLQSTHSPGCCKMISTVDVCTAAGAVG